MKNFTPDISWTIEDIEEAIKYLEEQGFKAEEFVLPEIRILGLRVRFDPRCRYPKVEARSDEGVRMGAILNSTPQIVIPLPVKRSPKDEPFAEEIEPYPV